MSHSLNSTVRDSMNGAQYTYSCTELQAGTVVPTSLDEYPNESLARHGYIGTAPVRPSIAIGFRTLEAYRQLHNVCPRLSIQAQVQALCHLHAVRINDSPVASWSTNHDQVPFNRGLVDQFSIAFDVYLEILHQVDRRADEALGRNAPDWRALNACVPCLYKLEGEAPLQYSMLVTMDGNHSLKLVDDMFRAGTTLRDDRCGRSPLWLTTEEVDRWKNEVRRSVRHRPADSLSAAALAPSPCSMSRLVRMLFPN